MHQVAPPRLITRPAPPLDRDHRPPLPPAPAAPEPPFEIEDLRAGAQSGPQQSLRRQQRDVVAGGDEVALPEILDPHQVQGTGAAFSLPPLPDLF
jgi:hypothetical protein